MDKLGNDLRVNQKVLLTIKRMGINGEGIADYKKKAVFLHFFRHLRDRYF